MKPLFVVVSVLAGLPLSAAEHQPFASAPSRLESPPSAQLADSSAEIRAIGVRLDLPIGPVRIDYGLPIQSNVQFDAPRSYHLLDAPGAGYREQRARANSK